MPKVKINESVDTLLEEYKTSYDKYVTRFKKCMKCNGEKGFRMFELPNGDMSNHEPAQTRCVCKLCGHEFNFYDRKYRN